MHRIVKTLLREGVDARGEAEETASQSAKSLLEHERREQLPRLRAESGGFDTPYEHAELAAIGQETSETERRAADAERELIETKKLKFMEDRVGEDFDAIVLSVTKYGFFVELGELFVEGLVPLHTLTDDRYTFREGAREIRGTSSGQVYRPGMRVRVLLDRIDRENRRLQFAVVAEAARGKVRRSAAGAPANVVDEGVATAGTRPWVPRKGKATSAGRGSGGAKVSSAKKEGGPLRAHSSPDRSGKPKRDGKPKKRGKAGGKRKPF